jgi:hypothetical protein
MPIYQQIGHPTLYGGVRLTANQTTDKKAFIVLQCRISPCESNSEELTTITKLKNSGFIFSHHGVAAKRNPALTDYTLNFRIYINGHAHHHRARGRAPALLAQHREWIRYVR